MTEKEEAALALIQQGMTIDEIVKATGYKTDSHIYKIAKINGLHIKSREERRAEAVSKMRTDGMMIKDIANNLGMSTGGVNGIIRRYDIGRVKTSMRCDCCGKEFSTDIRNQKYCCKACEKKANHERQKDGSAAVDEQTPVRMLANCSNEWEYVGGYSGSDGSMVIRHFCGYTTKRSCISIRHTHKIRCLVCEYREREARRKEAEKRKKIRREVKEFEKPVKQYQVQAVKSCAVCGGFFFGPGKYCGPECARKSRQHYDNMKKRRRQKSAWTEESKTITLQKLYERDGGVCWICGKPCNYEADSNSNEYPSIDHVIPIADGGKDLWENIRLAHRYCNSWRYFSEPETEPVNISPRL